MATKTKIGIAVDEARNEDLDALAFALDATKGTIVEAGTEKLIESLTPEQRARFLAARQARAR